MKNYFFLILALCLGFFNPGFAQTTSDPLQQFYRSRDVAKMEQSLTTFGKAEFDADKKLFSGVRNAAYTLEPNLTLNRPLSQLAGTIAPVGDNSSELKLQFERINLEIPAIQREFEANLTLGRNPGPSVPGCSRSFIQGKSNFVSNFIPPTLVGGSN
jgi:hypothetical protein